MNTSTLVVQVPDAQQVYAFPIFVVLYATNHTMSTAEIRANIASEVWTRSIEYINQFILYFISNYFSRCYRCYHRPDPGIELTSAVRLDQVEKH